MKDIQKSKALQACRLIVESKKKGEHGFFYGETLAEACEVAESALKLGNPNHTTTRPL